MWSHVGTLVKMKNGASSDLEKVKEDMEEIMEDPDKVAEILGDDAHLYI